MLTYSDVCERVEKTELAVQKGRESELRRGEVAELDAQLAGTQFTCFTGT
jgi:hypothetical protein